MTKKKIPVTYIPKHFEIDYKNQKYIIDGKEYPSTQHNADAVAEYLQTKNEAILKRLSTAVIVFG